MNVPILSPQTRWSCPNCTQTAMTQNPTPRFHNCAGLKGLTSPMVIDGTVCRILAVEREDYEGHEDVQRDTTGRPMMAVRTERGDGSNDTLILAPTAHVKLNN